MVKIGKNYQDYCPSYEYGGAPPMKMKFEITLLIIEMAIRKMGPI